MTKAEFLAATDNQCNNFLTQHGVSYDHLPRAVRSRLKHLYQAAELACPGDVAYDLAIYDKGAAIARGQDKAGAIANERGQLMRAEFVRLLERRNLFT